MRIGSRGRDHWNVATSRSADGDGRHNRGLIAVFVVIICSRGEPVRELVLWHNAVVLQPLTERKEWKFFGVLPKEIGRASCRERV